MRVPAAIFLSLALVPLLSTSETIEADQGEPVAASVRPGVLPNAWLLGGPKCVELPEFQVHEYNEDFYVLRQSGCSHFEKPFLFLLFGRDRALMLDTGAGKADVAHVVRNVAKSWLARNKRESIELVVAHSHAHDDHIAGDRQFSGQALTSLVPPDLAAVTAFFGIGDWPDEIVQFDLGGRILDIIPIPGHERTSIAIYDRQTAVLLTGDTLYPGRLYVEDPVAFTRSIRRLVEFTASRPVAHILGNHIENATTPYVDYPAGTVYQPDERALELGRSHLLELADALGGMDGKLQWVKLRDFTIWPVDE